MTKVAVARRAENSAKVLARLTVVPAGAALARPPVLTQGATLACHRVPVFAVLACRPSRLRHYRLPLNPIRHYPISGGGVVSVSRLAAGGGVSVRLFQRCEAGWAWANVRVIAKAATAE